MADEAKSLAEGKSPNVTPLFKEDFDISQSNPMALSDMNNFGGNFQGAPMVVPERITVNGDFDSKEPENDLARDLQGNGVSFETYMGGMVTPPRTLTVDDTAFNFAGKTGGKNNGEINAANGNEKNRVFQDTSGGDNAIHFQLQKEIVQLNNRVSWLEKKLDEKQSGSYWKTTLVCLLTVINPLLVHWLFSKRRF